MSIPDISNNKDLWKGSYTNPNKSSFPNVNKQQVYSNQNIGEKKQDKKQEDKSKLNWKNTMDFISVVLGLGVILIPLALHIREGKAEKIGQQAENLAKKSKSLATEVGDLKSGKNKKLPLVSKIGIYLDKLSERKELINNLIYSLGTILIEPLVILFSPFGKEKSSKEDKKFAVLRQPISFATTFGLQVSVDKFFHDLVPKLSRHGFLGNEFKSKLKDFGDLSFARKTKLKSLQETSIIVLNLAVLPISCMLQNVLYGKFTKYYYSHNKKESDKV